VAKRQRELVAEYQYTRDNFHMTDKEMAEAAPKIPQLLENIKREDEMTAIVGLGVYIALERGNINQAKEALVRPISSYYAVYRETGDTNLIAKIERTAQKYPALATEIFRQTSELKQGREKRP
jgi:hypothetical protein